MNRFLATCLLVTFPAIPAGAQRHPAPAAEITSGWAGFVDDATKHHAVAGAALRWYVSPRLSLGPEVVYMIGPGSDRDLYFTGNLVFDVLQPERGRRRRFTPYLVAGAGFFRHSDEFLRGTFVSYEGAFTGGGGARVFLSDRVYVAPELRVGWELHLRATATVGVSVR